MSNPTIKKPKDARLNTFELTTQGYVQTEQGIFNVANVNVMFTSDYRGETLSVCLPALQIVVPFEAVEALIEHTRKQRRLAENSKKENTESRG